MPAPRRRRLHRTAGALALALAAVTAGGAGGAAAEPASADSVAPYYPSLPSSNVFAKDVTRAPVHSRSAAMVANLDQQVTSRYGGIAAFNVWKYGVSVAQAGASQRTVDVRFDDCQGKGYTPPQLYGADGHFEDVPIPADAVPAAGSDGQLTVYSPSQDRMWEFWKARKTSSGWSACWGGRLDRVSRGTGVFTEGTGASASGLAVSMGAVRIHEAQAERIDHALTLAIPEIGHWKDWSYPAQRSDGSDRSWDAIPMGTRFRLDSDVDVDALGLHPVAAAVARAAQRYGFVVSDTSGAVAISTESGDAVKARTGSNPWNDVLDGTGSYAVMEGFPWHELEAIEEDWGAPR